MKRFSDFKFKRINEQEVAFGQNTNVTKEEPQTEEFKKSGVAKFASKIFESRQMAHVFHLQTRGDGSYAQHIALGEYYDGILDLIDSFIEVYAGQYQIIENYEIIDTTDAIDRNKVDYFVDLTEFIKSTRYTDISKEDTHLQNIIDEIVALIYRTLYKLKNLG
jgi:hypothetical protein